MEAAGVVVAELNIVSEVCRTGDRQVHQSLVIQGRDNVLLFR
jgi:hypothetical protein